MKARTGVTRRPLRSRWVVNTITGILTVGFLFIAVVSLPISTEWPSEIRDRIVSRGYEDTGAPNLVSAIYLGYRAIDTLGETIVLLLAVTGTVFHLKSEHNENH